MDVLDLCMDIDTSLKSTIVLMIETHAYAEEMLCDDILNEDLGDDLDSCGVVEPEIVFSLRKNRSVQLVLKYTTDTTLYDVKKSICEKFGLDSPYEFGRIQMSFFSNGLRYWIDNYSVALKTIVDQYLDPLGKGYISVALYVSADAGRIFEEDGIRYYMNSRERGRHHEPHVHIECASSQDDAVILIKTGKIIGKFPHKLAKKAIKKVLDNQKFFIEQWNTLTDGLAVDVNRFWGLINY